MSDWPTWAISAGGIVSAGYGAYIAAKASQRVAAIGAEAAGRTADRLADVDRARLQQEALDKLITRLTEEIGRTQHHVDELRTQVRQEQQLSDDLRQRIRELEDLVHQMSQTIADLRRQRITDDADEARNGGAG